MNIYICRYRMTSFDRYYGSPGGPFLMSINTFSKNKLQKKFINFRIAKSGGPSNLFYFYQRYRILFLNFKAYMY